MVNLNKYSGYHVLLFLVVLLAIGLRLLYFFLDLPFSHDELSMISRLKVHSFSELIQNGVLIDTHPAGVHVFYYYWSKLFGFSEISMRVPAFMMGLFALYPMYKIALEFFSKPVALMTLIFCGLLQFPLMHSMYARPYAFGMLFCWSFVWSLLQFKSDPSWRKIIYVILWFVLSMYTHYFAFLFVVSTGFIAILLYRSLRLNPKLWLGVAVACMLYLPHISILLSHMSQGGLVWLQKPNWTFFIHYFRYLFQFEFALITLAVIGLLHAIGWGLQSKSKAKIIVFLGSIFLVLPLVGWFYSVYRAPILQYSLLVFSVPAGYMIMASLYTHLKRSRLILAPVLLVFILISLLSNRQHFTMMQKHPYKLNMLRYDSLKNQNASLGLMLQDNPKYFLWYADQLQIDCRVKTLFRTTFFDWHQENQITLNKWKEQKTCMVVGVDRYTLFQFSQLFQFHLQTL